MSHGGPVYEPRFYERAAQHHVARLFPGPVFVNVRWGLSGSLPTRHELDALAFRTRQAVPIEIKAHSLNNADTDEINAKYRGIRFRHIMLVVPATSAKVGRRLAEMRIPSIELVLFPDLDAIRDWYCTWWPQAVPTWTRAALASGRHHVRFVLTRPTERGRFVIGQQRTRIYSADTVLQLTGYADLHLSPPDRGSQAQPGETGHRRDRRQMLVIYHAEAGTSSAEKLALLASLASPTAAAASHTIHH